MGGKKGGRRELGGSEGKKVYKTKKTGAEQERKKAGRRTRKGRNLLSGTHDLRCSTKSEEREMDSAT